MNVRYKLTQEEIDQMLEQLKDEDDEYIEMVLAGIPGHPITLEDVRKKAGK